MLNHITLMGRLTKDPELRYTQSNVPVASFTLACDRDYSGQGQEKQTDFVDCVAWRNTGEFVSKYFSKGRMMVVSGRLQSRKWRDRDDNPRTSWEINVDNAYFGDSKRDGDSGGSYGGQAPASYSGQSSGGYGNSYGAPSSGYNPPPRANENRQSAFEELDDDDGELPF